MATSTVPGGEKGGELARVWTLQLDVENQRSADEKTHEPRSGMFGNKAGGGYPHQPLAASRLTHLTDGAFLASRASSPARLASRSPPGVKPAHCGPGRRAGFPEFLAQVANGSDNGGLRSRLSSAARRVHLAQAHTG